MDISETLAPKSDQLDNIDLRGSDPRIFTVTKVDVKPGTDQPVTVHLAEFPRPWKPGKNMRRVLAHYWGRESDNWPGKHVELFSDEGVKFGNETPGGTRISRMSHIEKVKTPAAVMLSQGKAGTYKVEPLPPQTSDPGATRAPSRTESSAIDNAECSTPGSELDLETERAIADLRAEWKSATDERKAEIQAEVAKLQGASS